MGRGKVTLKYIQNEKDRKISFGQRIEGLTKKVSKFSSNFEVESCLIVYDGDNRLMTWPQNSTNVQTMLKKYEHQKIETTPKKFDVGDYFAIKKTIVEDKITRVRKEIAMNKYPTWGEFFQGMGEEQLNVCLGMVGSKIKACNQRINKLKNVQQSENISTHIMDEQEKIDVMHNIPMKPINKMVDLTNHVLSTNKHEEWYNQLFRLDDWVKELHNDYINEIIHYTNDVDVQQGEISFMLNTTPGNVILSHNIPEKQHILDNPIKHDVNFINVDVPHVSSKNQVDELVVLNSLVAEAAKPMDEDNEVIDFDDDVNWVSQPDVFAKQGLSLLSKNQQHIETMGVGQH
ncbi:agamous MADS-box protein AGL82 [Trifolium repens]|nr:agamous MADS-box protein AGL82 [Trifolium repens]